MKTQSQDILPDIRLRFNIDNPDLEDVWNEGYDAAVRGTAEESNPFELDSKAYNFWNEGWWAGFYGEERLSISDDVRIVEEDNTVTTLKGVPDAANQPSWDKKDIKKWLGRVVKIAGAIAVTVAAYELADIAV